MSERAGEKKEDLAITSSDLKDAASQLESSQVEDPEFKHLIGNSSENTNDAEPGNSLTQASSKSKDIAELGIGAKAAPAKKEDAKKAAAIKKGGNANQYSDLFGDDKKKKGANRFTWGGDKKGIRSYGDFDYNTP